MIELLSIPIILLAIAAFGLASCITYIGPNERGLLIKKFGSALPAGQFIAFNGEAGYQGKLVESGWRIVLRPIYDIERIPLVQTTEDGGGMIISQIGADIPKGFLNATGKDLTLEDFKNPESFISKGGQKGIQRIMLPVSTTAEIHPVAFLVVTTKRTYGKSLTKDKGQEQNLTLSPKLTVISQRTRGDQ